MTRAQDLHALRRDVADLIGEITAYDLLKADPASVEVQQICDETFRRLLRAGIFSQLEEEGNVRLANEARGAVAAIVASYGFLAKARRLLQRRREEEHGLLHQIEAISDKIEARHHDCEEDIAIGKAAARELRAYGAQALCRWPSSGRPVHVENDISIYLLACVYDASGGRVAGSSNGPFMRFLQTAFEAFAVDDCTSETFARRAKKTMRDLQDATREHARYAEFRQRRYGIAWPQLPDYLRGAAKFWRSADVMLGCGEWDTREGHRAGNLPPH